MQIHLLVNKVLDDFGKGSGVHIPLSALNTQIKQDDE